jgi:Zinc finger, C3HC4 type (RING finger)
MASSLPSVVDESLLQCPLCCCPAADPTLLPCLHVFCRACLEHYVKKRNAPAFNPEAAAPIAPASGACSEGKSGTLNNGSKPRQTDRGLGDAKQYVYGAASPVATFAQNEKVSRQSSLGDTLPPAPPIPAVAAAAKVVAAASSHRDDSADENENGYEIPNDIQHNVQLLPDDNTYEDVDDVDERTYVNSGGWQQMAAASTSGSDSRKIERGSLGYVSMGTRKCVSSQVDTVDVVNCVTQRVNLCPYIILLP